MVRFVAAQLKLKRTRAWLLVLAGLSAALCFVPLFNLLAYEFCLATALAGSLAAAHLGSVAVAAARERDEGLLLGLSPPPRALLTLVARAAASNLLLLVLPLGLIALNALRVKNCDPLEGLAFYALMPAASVVIASTAGVLWGLAIPRPALATTAALLTVVGSIAWGVYRFYAAPPIFGHDPFAGYFPGALYDQDVAIRAPFAWARLYHLAWITAAVLAAAHLFDPADGLRLRLARLRPRQLATPALLAALAAGVALYLARGPLGFAIDGEQIAAELGGTRHTEHFVIYYPAGELEPWEVDLLVQDHEFRHAQLRRFFGDAPPGRITSFIFASTAQKRRLIGAGRTFIAKPWRREIYLHQAAFPHRVLKHELAHVFAGPHGDSWFGVSLRWRAAPLPHPVFNVGLIEGVAVAADWRPYGELTAHQMAAALLRIGLAPRLKPLFGYGFLGGAASRAYTLAGSFCRYLVRTRGRDRLLRAFASGGDFPAAYDGATLEQLLAEWSAWLGRVHVPAAQLQLARERFRRPGVFGRVCSHEVANLLAEAGALLADEPRRAAAIYEQVWAFDPGEPSHLLRWMHAETAAGRTGQARAIGARLLEHPALSKPLRRRALSTLGDLSWLEDRRADARRRYRQAAGLAAPPHARRLLHLKRWALDRDDEVGRLLRDYLVKEPGSEREAGLDVHLAHRLAAALPDSGLGQYLVGKQLAAHDHFCAARRPLRRALELELPGRDFVVEAWRALGATSYLCRDHLGARRAFAELVGIADLPAGLRLEAEDWLERIRWRRGDPLHARRRHITPMISSQIVKAKKSQGKTRNRD